MKNKEEQTYQEAIAALAGLRWIRLEILKLDEKFFTPLENPEFGGCEWDLILGAIKRGIESYKAPVGLDPSWKRAQLDACMRLTQRELTKLRGKIGPLKPGETVFNQELLFEKERE